MIDITISHVGVFHWWDDSSPKLKFEHYEVFHVGYVCMSLHSGTHIDLPMHVGLEREVKLKDIYRVIVVSPEKACSEIKNKTSIDGVLIKTGQGHLIRQGTIGKDYKGIDERTTQCLVKRKISIVGIDAPSIEKYTGDGSIHKMFLEKDVPILENIDLTGVDEGIYDLYLFPLKVDKMVDALPAVAKLQVVGEGK